MDANIIVFPKLSMDAFFTLVLVVMKINFMFSFNLFIWGAQHHKVWPHNHGCLLQWVLFMGCIYLPQFYRFNHGNMTFFVFMFFSLNLNSFRKGHLMIAFLNEKIELDNIKFVHVCENCIIWHSFGKFLKF